MFSNSSSCQNLIGQFQSAFFDAYDFFLLNFLWNINGWELVHHIKFVSCNMSMKLFILLVSGVCLNLLVQVFILCRLVRVDMKEHFTVNHIITCHGVFQEVHHWTALIFCHNQEDRVLVLQLDFTGYIVLMLPQKENHRRCLCTWLV